MNDPTTEYQKICPDCLETIHYQDGYWMHWETGDIECIETFDLFETITEIIKPS